MEKQQDFQEERTSGGAPPGGGSPCLRPLHVVAGPPVTPSSGGKPPATPPSWLKILAVWGVLLGTGVSGSALAQVNPSLGADQLALTVIFDDRLSEEIRAPVALAVLSDGREFKVNLTDDGSFAGDEANDHVWVADLIFPRSQSITFSLRHDVQGQATTLFTRMFGLPAAASARVAIRAPEHYEDTFEVRDPYFFSDPRTLAAGLIPSWETQQVVAPQIVPVPTPPPGAGVAPPSAGVAPPSMMVPMPPGGPGVATTSSTSSPQGSLLWLWGVVLFLLWRELRPGSTRLSLWLLGSGANHLPPGWRARTRAWATTQLRRGELPPGFTPLTTWQVGSFAHGGELQWITRPPELDPLDWLLDQAWQLTVKQDLPCLLLTHPDVRNTLALAWQNRVNAAGLTSHLTPRVLFFTGEVAELPELEVWLHRWGKAAILCENLELLGLVDDLVEREPGLARAAAHLFLWHRRLPGLTLWVGATPSDLIALERGLSDAEEQVPSPGEGWSPPGETLAGESPPYRLPTGDVLVDPRGGESP